MRSSTLRGELTSWYLLFCSLSPGMLKLQVNSTFWSLAECGRNVFAQPHCLLSLALRASACPQTHMCTHTPHARTTHAHTHSFPFCVHSLTILPMTFWFYLLIVLKENQVFFTHLHSLNTESIQVIDRLTVSLHVYWILLCRAVDFTLSLLWSRKWVIIASFPDLD